MACEMANVETRKISSCAVTACERANEAAPVMTSCCTNGGKGGRLDCHCSHDGLVVVVVGGGSCCRGCCHAHLVLPLQQ